MQTLPPSLNHLENHGRAEEIANAITHGIGAGRAIAALAILVTFAGLQGDPWKVVSFSVYGAMLVIPLSHRDVSASLLVEHDMRSFDASTHTSRGERALPPRANSSSSRS